MAKNKFFYPIFAIYLFYPLLYIFKDCYRCGYRIINHFDQILLFLWICIGIFAGLVIFYAIWRRKKPYADNPRTGLHVLSAVLLFLLFYPYVMAITWIDVGLFGLRW